MYTSKKSFFIPSEFKLKDIPPIKITDENKTNLREHIQGFYHTGEYFLIQHEDQDMMGETRVHVIRFNQDRIAFEHIVVKIELTCDDQHCYGANKLDLSTGTLIHTIERKQRKRKINSNSGYILDIYRYNIIEFVKENRGHSLKMEEKSTPDLSLVYDESEFNCFEYDLVHSSGEHSLSLFFFVMFWGQREKEYEEDHDDHYFYPRCCVDIVDIKQGQTNHRKRFFLDLSKLNQIVTPPYFPRRYCTNHRIFFYKEESHPSGVSIDEYDSTGNFAFSYFKHIGPGDIWEWEWHFESIKETNYMFLYLRKNTLPDCVIRIYKLEQGSISLVNEIENVIWNGIIDHSEYDFERPFKRLDRLILPAKTYYESFYDFVLLGLSTKSTVCQLISENVNWPIYSVNWNLDEIAMTYYADEDDEVDLTEFYFKMVHNNTVEGKGSVKSLKHLARFAVLTSFNYHQLMEANLPSTLFDYLGIEK